jgi:7,8-dihydro-6-hydroxymethylpterin-pyrophosphokinase
MGIINKINKPVQQANQSVNQLNTSELEFLLTMLRTSTLTGEQVELFYNMVIKLQNQYTEQTK